MGAQSLGCPSRIVRPLLETGGPPSSHSLDSLAWALVMALSPTTITTDLSGLRLYRHWLAYWLTMSSICCSSSGELAMRAKSSAYIGVPQYSPLMETSSPDEVRVSSSSSTKRQYRYGERTPPCRTPCLMGNSLDSCPFQSTGGVPFINSVPYRACYTLLVQLDE